jgi:hypothetical protein
MIERFNRTLGTMLKQVTADHQKDWDTYLPFLCMAYRSTQHETTGYTPNMMMLGRELPMPSYLLLPPPEPYKEKHPGEYVKLLQQKLQEVHQVAREKLEGGHVKQKKQYDKSAHLRKWKEGQAVWLYNPTKTVGKSPKLTIFWEAQPYVITKVISDVIMKIQREKGSKPRVVHVDRLKPVERVVDTSWYHPTDDQETRLDPSHPRVIQGQGQAPIHGELVTGDHLSILQEMGLEPQESEVFITRKGRPSRPPVKWGYK